MKKTKVSVSLYILEIINIINESENEDLDVYLVIKCGD